MAHRNSSTSAARECRHPPQVMHIGSTRMYVRLTGIIHVNLIFLCFRPDEHVYVLVGVDACHGMNLSNEITYHRQGDQAIGVNGLW
jgi:hypothetical protein